MSRSSSVVTPAGAPPSGAAAARQRAGMPASSSSFSSPPTASSAAAGSFASSAAVAATPAASAGGILRANVAATPAVVPQRTAEQLDRAAQDARLGYLLGHPFEHASQATTHFRTDLLERRADSLQERMDRLRGIEKEIEQDDWLFGS